ncbi:hypothetical protein EZS27_037689 [termite gut metagenome]|uniref:Uncharacterized protein n=1 Tax=termite gut metagenome TaxID=433724 RepID=A0A5J4PNS0_9ZZZZ
MKEMNYEAILGMMSEISKKLDAIQTISKTKEIQPVNQEINPVISKEEIESIVKNKPLLLGNTWNIHIKYRQSITINCSLQLVV